MTVPKHSRMTAGQLRRGFEQIPRPCPAAVLFGLDASMSAEDVITLTWPAAKDMIKSGKLSEYAIHILKSQPVHIACQYVFWLEKDGKPEPLFDLEWLTVQIFGLLWSELGLSCERLIWIDEEADKWSWDEQWTKVTS